MNTPTPTFIKHSLKQLKKQKGVKCRAIGEAKNNNQSFKSLTNEVQELSLQIKLLEAQLKEKRNQETEPDGSSLNVLPSQFLTNQYLEVSNGKFTVLKDTMTKTWDDYVNRHPNATIYHSRAMCRVVEDSFGHKCHYLSVVDNKGKIQGILPLVEMKSLLFGHFLVSMPFYNYGGLLASSKHAEDKLLETAAELALKLGVDHVEYRDCYPNSKLLARTDKITMLRPLPKDTDDLWKEIGTKIRAQIKKCERYNPVTKVGQIELVDDFYMVFSRNMRDLGTPVYDKEFFINMLRYVPDSKIVIIYLNGIPISAAFLIGWRNTLEIPWASTIGSANKYDANMKLYWEVLKVAIQKHYQVFDFGRSSKDSNTYKFKKQWGSSPRSLFWHYWLKSDQELPQLNPKNPKYALLSTSWKLLPLCFANKIGPIIVKNLP